MGGQRYCCMDEEWITKTNFEMREEMKAWKEKVVAMGFHDDDEAHHAISHHYVWQTIGSGMLGRRGRAGRGRGPYLRGL